MNKSKCLATVVSYNDGERLKKTLASKPGDFPYDILLVNDGSTDGSFDDVDTNAYKIIRNEVNSGIGVNIRKACKYAKENGYDIIALMPGNNKNTLAEIDRLVEPILKNKADYVQGSRYLPGSRRDHTPLFRLVMVKVLAAILSYLTGRKITDSMEGFRAFRLSILDDPDIDVYQDWLDRYGLEIYLFFKITYGRKYRYKEVSISKLYPKDKVTIFNPKGVKYSKIKPFVDWWDILRPIPLLLFGIKK
jgi:glycosyltransferase involved in cell wall biosynthesis